MRLLVLPAVLKTAIASLSQVLSSKNSMPVLDNILLRPGDTDTSVLLTASDGDNMLTLQLQCDEVEDVTPFLLPADLVKYARGLSDWPVTIETQGDDVSVSDMFGEFHCVGSTATESYPLIALPAGGVSVSVPADRYLSAMKAGLRFTATDDLRPQMNGIYCRFASDGLRIASSNAKTLFTDTVGDVASADGQVIVSRKVVTAANAVFDMKGDAVTVSFDDKRIALQQGSTTLVGTQIEGRFPRYESIIPKNNDSIVVIDAQQLQAAIGRAMLSAGSTGLFSLSFDGKDTLVIQTEDIDFSRSGKVTVKTVSQTKLSNGLTIGVRGQYLSDILSSAFAGCKTVSLLLSDPQRAIIIKQQEDTPRLALLMPMQLH